MSRVIIPYFMMLLSDICSLTHPYGSGCVFFIALKTYLLGKLLKVARKLPETKNKNLVTPMLQGFALVEVRRIELLYVCKALYKNTIK